ncbi:hypothetical protein E6H30_01040 [Candidatus Bathyarchaeota archaeon]|nr:MAG: hypothetical protein E6H30_01040 [Candidatus Bathyarchaeota archaeon]
MIGMHAHQPTQATGQNPLGQAVQMATTQGLLLLVPPQLQDICPICGHMQFAGWRFCSSCGTRLRCPSCNAQSLGKNYCHNCGIALRS